MHTIRIFQSATTFTAEMVSFTLVQKYPTIIMPNMFIYVKKKGQKESIIPKNELCEPADLNW